MTEPPPPSPALAPAPRASGPRRVLVTGGSGFVGQHLVRQLVARGDTVRSLDIALPRDRARDYEFQQGSILDADALRRALAKVERLYHVAGNPNLWTARKSEFARVNHEGTRRVLAEAARHDIERIVYTSTESILKGRRARRDDGLIDETVSLALDDMPGPYCRSKFLGEQEALAAARRGQPVVIVNPTLPVGPGDHFLTPPTAMVLRFLNAGTPAYLDCELNFIDVRAAAAGHILAAERGTVGERYILGGENLTLSAVLDMLRELTGLPMPRFRVPYWLALGASAIDETIADLVTHTPPAAPLTGLRLARSPNRFSSAKSIRELGLPQMPIKAAFADLVRWLDAEGYLKRKLPASARGAALGVQRQ